VHPVGKNYALDRKMIGTSINGLDVLYHRANENSFWCILKPKKLSKAQFNFVNFDILTQKTDMPKDMVGVPVLKLLDQWPCN